MWRCSIKILEKVYQKNLSVKAKNRSIFLWSQHKNSREGFTEHSLGQSKIRNHFFVVGSVKILAQDYQKFFQPMKDQEMICEQDQSRNSPSKETEE